MTRAVSSAGRLMTAAAVGLLVVSLMTGATLEVGASRDVVGKVTAIDVGSGTIVMDAPMGETVLTVGAEVPKQASITAGKLTKSLSDIKVGDNIKMKYVREENKLVVQSIVIQ